MPRAERIWFPGAVYHIIQRGNAKQEIFLENRDYEWFLKTVKEAKDEIKFEVYCYALMGNHYHMTIATKESHISDIMYFINSRYANRFNKKYGRSGHLFQGRFKGLLVDTDSYLLELSRYVHLNPVKAGLTATPGGYPWSSYRCYVENVKDDLVETELILAFFQSVSGNSRENYKSFINEKLARIKDEKDWLKHNIKQQRFLGNKEFVKRALKHKN